MATTTIQPLPYPLPGDPADGPAQIKALAEAVEGRVVMRFASLAARDAALPSGKLVDGMMCHVASENAVYLRSGGKWRLLWREATAAITPAAGYTGSGTGLASSAGRVRVSGALMTTAGLSLTTSLVQIGSVPVAFAPPVNRWFTTGIFTGGVAQVRVTPAGAIEARALSGTIAIPAGGAIYLDGIIYDA